MWGGFYVRAGFPSNPPPPGDGGGVLENPAPHKGGVAWVCWCPPQKTEHPNNPTTIGFNCTLSVSKCRRTNESLERGVPLTPLR